MVTFFNEQKYKQDLELEKQVIGNAFKNDYQKQEKYINEYQLRELTLIAEKKVSEINTDIDIKSFESIDTIVTNQITNIESDHYDPKLLLEIYRNL